jgi:hypothetical protein
MEKDYYGAKLINIFAQASYPIVTAYEFEFLKTEAEVKSIIKGSTIYLIVQRPLLYIKNLTMDGCVLKFIITDCHEKTILDCTLDPRQAAFNIDDDEDILINVQFYKNTPDTEQPYNDVAAIKFLRLDNSFIAWLTPQKIIFEYIAGIINMEIIGNIIDFIDYKVHYIGQAFDQVIWNRLTGHEKMQSVLTKEDSICNSVNKNSFEISLILLEVMGYDELNAFPLQDSMLKKYPKRCLFKLQNTEDFVKFNTPILAPKAPELTNEVEALLISSFKPVYNIKKFNNYPDIKKGVRSVGYAGANLVIEKLPAKLYTDNHSQEAVLIQKE